MKTKIVSIFAHLVTRPPFAIFFSHSLLMGRLKKWYRTNGIYKFAKGQKIRLMAPNIFGYGIRPEAVVKDYAISEDGENKYVLEMTCDSDGDFDRHLAEGWVPPDVERVTAEETHFKWNIEHHFVPV